MTEPLVDDSLALPDGRTLAWAEYGDAAGEPLFFFHGLPGSRRFCLALADDASALGIRIVAPDRPGFGGSTFQPDRKFTDWPADVAALADHIGVDRFIVSGISGGGVYVLTSAHQLSDRVRSAGVISGAGEMKSAADFEGMHDQNKAIFQLALDAGADGVATAMAPMIEMLKGDPQVAMQAFMAGAPPADVELLERRADIREMMPTDALEAMRDGVAGTAHEAAMFVRPWGFDVGEITVPVVLWHGDDDRNAPLSHAQALADRIPNAELVVWTGMGHLTAIDRVQDILGHLLKVAK